MTLLDAQAPSVTVDVAGPYALSVGASGSAKQMEDAMAAAAEFPAWSTLSWQERADFVERYCR